MQQKMKRILAYLLLLSLFVTGIAGNTVTTEAAAKPVRIKLSGADIKKLGFDTVMQRALNEAKEKATAKKPYEITVPKGKYQLKHTLLIYSNTKVLLKGVTLYAGEGKNVFHVGALDEDSKGATGYCYKNITIQGGTLDGKKHSGTVLKVGHAENVVLKDATLCNVKNAHLMETGGVKKLTVKNCTFKNQTSTSDGITYYEAIQLDVLYPWHLVAYRGETLNTTDVLIEGCSFTNTPRGVGSHTAILNQPMKNITITDCTFTKMGSIAIQGLNWQNAIIKNNVIQDSPRGIVCYLAAGMGQGTYLPSVIAKAGKTKTPLSDQYAAPREDMKLVIQNNTITTNDKTDPYAFYERLAIAVNGIEIRERMKKNKDKSGALPVGNYYYSGVKILDNTITTAGHGIRCMDARKVEISGNSITAKEGSNNAGYNGIQLLEKCEDISIYNNEIRDMGNNGIYVNRESKAKEIAKNTVTGCGKYGIGLETAEAERITENVISNVKEKGIFVYNKASVQEISGNTIDTVLDAKGRGIHVCEQSAAGAVMKNVLNNPGEYGIIASSSSSIDEVSENEIAGATVKPIYAPRGSTIKSGY